MSSDTAELVARRFLHSGAVEQSITRIVRELEAAQSSLDGARPARENLAETLEQALGRIGAAKGRPPLYPYVGSGIGRGPLVEMLDGSVKWDMITGIGVHIFGHSDPDLVATALRAAMSDTVMQGNLQANEDAVRFADLLIEQASRDSGLRYCFLTGSGAMANESALKIAMHRRDGRAARVLAFADCFMGRSTTMAQIGDNPGGRVGLPLSTLVDYMPFYDPDHGDRSIEYAVYHLRQYLDRYPGQHACFVMELVQGEGGFNVAPAAFFEPLMRLCRERDVAVWVDEVQTFGRTPRMFYFDELGLGQHVDVVTLGKMSQVCACLYTEQMNPQPGLLSGTFVGSTVGLQVGQRILERLRDGGYYRAADDEGRINRLHRCFCEHVQALVDKHPDWFPPVPHPLGLTRVAPGYYGGVGGMMRFTPFAGDKAHIMKLLHRMFDLGVIAFYCGHGPYHVRMLPPVGSMQPQQLADVFAIVELAMAEVAAEIGTGAGCAS